MESIQQKQATAITTGLKNPLIVSNPKLAGAIQKKTVKVEGIGTQMKKLVDVLTKEKMEKETNENKKEWKFPFKWKRIMNKSLKPSKLDMVLCFFINKKGELDPPVLLPIYNGNTLIYKYTIHELDPRDIITLHHKKKSYKLLIYRLMDRKAISNRDYGEVKERGESTIDDEVFIKAMLTAKASQISKQQIGKGALIIGGLVVAGIIIWFFSRS